MYQENRRIDSNRYYSEGKIDTIIIRIWGKSILSWFARGENRCYHDSHFENIDTIMICLGGESILSWFANLEKNWFESMNKIDENRQNRFKSILSTGYRCESFFCTIEIIRTVLYNTLCCIRWLYCTSKSRAWIQDIFDFVYSCIFYVWGTWLKLIWWLLTGVYSPLVAKIYLS